MGAGAREGNKGRGVGGAEAWEGTTRQGPGREQGRSRSLGGDSSTGACEGHEYGTGTKGVKGSVRVKEQGRGQDSRQEREYGAGTRAYREY